MRHEAAPCRSRCAIAVARPQFGSAKRPSVASLSLYRSKPAVTPRWQLFDAVADRGVVVGELAPRHAGRAAERLRELRRRSPVRCAAASLIGACTPREARTVLDESSVEMHCSPPGRRSLSVRPSVGSSSADLARMAVGAIELGGDVQREPAALQRGEHARRIGRGDAEVAAEREQRLHVAVEQAVDHAGRIAPGIAAQPHAGEGALRGCRATPSSPSRSRPWCGRPARWNARAPASRPHRGGRCCRAAAAG